MTDPALDLPADFPADPVAAVTHRDPWPCYAVLRRARPFGYDESLRMWVAADAASVAAVLTSPLARVRPPAEPVPAALQGTTAGAVFARLVRQNDAPARDDLKMRLVAVLAALGDDDAVAAMVRARLAALRDAPLDDLLFALPVQTLAGLLGLDHADLPAIAAEVTLLVQALAPGADAARVAAGSAAAETLLGRLRRAGHGEGDDALQANILGLLVQSHDACAGLLGHALLVLMGRPALRAQLAATPQWLPAFTAEVMRHAAPVQNTRRWLAADGEICGRRLRQGEAVLVLLAGASRDPALYAEPDRFVIARAARIAPGFGQGSHACAGPRLALTITAAAIAGLLVADAIPAADVTAIGYRPSVNARIPLFATLFP